MIRIDGENLETGNGEMNRAVKSSPYYKGLFTSQSFITACI